MEWKRRFRGEQQERNRTEGQSWFAALAGGSFPDWLVGLGGPWSRLGGDTSHMTHYISIIM